MLSLEYPRDNPEFKVTLDPVECGYADLSFHYKNGNRFNSKADLNLRHSLNVLNKVFSGNFPKPKGHRGALKDIYSKYSGILGEEKVPQNLSYALIVNYPKCINHDDFNNGFKPMSARDLEHIVDSKKNAKFSISREEESKIFKSLNYYENRLSKLAKQILNRKKEDRPYWEEIKKLLGNYNNVNSFFDGIATMNQGIVFDMAKLIVERKRVSIDPNDLIGSGYLSLYKAINSFNASRGFRFSTYVSNSLLRAFSRHLQEEIKHNHLAMDLYFEPDDHIYRSRGEELMLQSNLVNEIMKLNLADLSERELRIVNGRFKTSEKKETLSALGKEFDLSKERIRQLETKALKKIKLTFDIEYFERYGQ
jgi:RNA polymerase sigma factor (sigma-70 family)